jgi:hypothetical protein
VHSRAIGGYRQLSVHESSPYNQQIGHADNENDGLTRKIFKKPVLQYAWFSIPTKPTDNFFKKNRLKTFFLKYLGSIFQKKRSVVPQSKPNHAHEQSLEYRNLDESNTIGERKSLVPPIIAARASIKLLLFDGASRMEILLQ